MTEEVLALNIVETLMEEMSGRRGFSQLFDSIDEDVMQEIKSAWVEIVNMELQKACVIE